MVRERFGCKSRSVDQFQQATKGGVVVSYSLLNQISMGDQTADEVDLAVALRDMGEPFGMQQDAS